MLTLQILKQTSISFLSEVGEMAASIYPPLAPSRDPIPLEAYYFMLETFMNTHYASRAVTQRPRKITTHLSAYLPRKQ